MVDAKSDRMLSSDAMQSQLDNSAMYSAMRNPDVPHVYANNIGLALTATDISVAFGQSSAPAVVVDLAFGTAKFLGQQLLAIVQEFETATGTQVKSPNELRGAMEKLMKARDARRI